jgi:hypothetical protein
MQHALLLNPFNLNQEPSKPARAAKFVGRQASRSTPVCASCQSDDIISSATVQWSNESQGWELANTFDQPTHCNNCKGACDIIWRPLN